MNWKSANLWVGTFAILAAAGGVTAAAGGLFHSKQMVIAGAVLGAPLVAGVVVLVLFVSPIAAWANRRAAAKEKRSPPARPGSPPEPGTGPQG